jgi:hypothetical protein
MNIRFISSLTPDDEAKLAPVLLDLIGALLDRLPLAYTLRIEPSAGTVVQRSRADGPHEPSSAATGSAAV